MGKYAPAVVIRIVFQEGTPGNRRTGAKLSGVQPSAGIIDRAAVGIAGANAETVQHALFIAARSGHNMQRVIRVVREIGAVVAEQVTVEDGLVGRDVAGIGVGGTKSGVTASDCEAAESSWNVAFRSPGVLPAPWSGLYVPLATRTSVTVPPEPAAAVRASCRYLCAVAQVRPSPPAGASSSTYSTDCPEAVEAATMETSTNPTIVVPIE